MMDERQEELASLYALDLLEGAERDAFEKALAGDPGLREHVRQLRESASTLAHAAPSAPPPPELKARLLESAEKARPSTKRPPRGNVIPFPVWLGWAAAACVTLAAAWLGRLYFAANSENGDLHLALTIANRRLAVAQSTVADLNREIKDRENLARFKIAVLASLAGNTPEARAVAVWDPERQEGVLDVSKLPAVAKSKNYQLWVIDPQYPAPVSGGVFEVDGSSGKAHVTFRAVKPVHKAAAFAISVERLGGAPAPEGPIVLMSQ